MFVWQIGFWRKEILRIETGAIMRAGLRAEEMSGRRRGGAGNFALHNMIATIKCQYCTHQFEAEAEEINLLCPCCGHRASGLSNPTPATVVNRLPTLPKMVNCRCCGNEVSRRAHWCPCCGEPQPARPGLFETTCIVVVIASIALFLIGIALAVIFGVGSQVMR